MLPRAVPRSRVALRQAQHTASRTRRFSALFLILPGKSCLELTSLFSTRWPGWKTRDTNAQGQYTFVRLRAGKYQIVATSSGFDQLPVDIDLAAGEKRILRPPFEVERLRDKVVVSAAPGGALTSQIAASVSVVSAEEIEDRGAQVAVDVMRGLPGVEINQSGGRGTITSAFIRGGDSNYNLVMIDGIELNDFGGGFDLSPLPAEGVQQVEVIRGPESALYGSNAMSGVINLETIHGDGPPHFSFVGEGGSLVHVAVRNNRSGTE